MKDSAKIEIAVSGGGFVLTALGVLLPGSFFVAFVGVLLTAIGLGMLVRGAIE